MYRYFSWMELCIERYLQLDSYYIKLKYTILYRYANFPSVNTIFLAHHYQDLWPNASGADPRTSPWRKKMCWLVVQPLKKQLKKRMYVCMHACMYVCVYTHQKNHYICRILLLVIIIFTYIYILYHVLCIYIYAYKCTIHMILSIHSVTLGYWKNSEWSANSSLTKQREDVAWSSSSVLSRRIWSCLKKSHCWENVKPQTIQHWLGNSAVWHHNLIHIVGIVGSLSRVSWRRFDAKMAASFWYLTPRGWGHQAFGGTVHIAIILELQCTGSWAYFESFLMSTMN